LSNPCGAGLGGNWLSARRGERNLSGVKQLGCVVVINGVDEHGVRDTGDEFADAFQALE
jgi:hypothetical protein